MEGAGECVGNISTINQEMEAALGALECMKHRKDFASLGGLVTTHDRSMETFTVRGSEAPARAGPAAVMWHPPSVAMRVTRSETNGSGSQ